MRSYVVMLPPGPAEPRPEDWRLLPDGFSRWALLFPAPWLLAHRLWVAGALALILPWAAVFALPADEETLAAAFLLVSFAVALAAGFEGRARVIDRLARRGHRTIGVIEARTREEAEDKLAAFATLGRVRTVPHGPVEVGPPSDRTRWSHPGYRRPVVTDAPVGATRASLLPLGGR